MDPISLLIAALIGGTIIGFVEHHRNNRTPKQPKPICVCRHARSMHDSKGCHWTSTQRVKKRDNSTYTMNEYGDSVLAKADIEWETVVYTCDCKEYDGPIPIDQYFTPKMIDNA